MDTKNHGERSQSDWKKKINTLQKVKLFNFYHCKQTPKTLAFIWDFEYFTLHNYKYGIIKIIWMNNLKILIPKDSNDIERIIANI